MSVFKKLKGTFQNAQQDIKDGLRALTIFDGSSKSAQIQHIVSKDINLDAGADLLHEYQEVWSSIHMEMKQCARKAEDANEVLTPMFMVWDQRLGVVAALEEEVKSIPKIVSSLKDLQTLLETVRQDFSITESSLSILENLCDEIDLKSSMDKETKKLNIYRCAKDKELDKIKVNLALNHAKKVQDIESSKSQKMKERADAFTSAFEEDLDYYKTHGRPDCKLVTEFPKVTSLSEIDLVDDGKDLDNFLGPQNEEEQDNGEEQYFEDDYINDYAVKEDLGAPEEEDDFREPLFSFDNEDHLPQELDSNCHQDNPELKLKVDGVSESETIQKDRRNRELQKPQSETSLEKEHLPDNAEET